MSRGRSEWKGVKRHSVDQYNRPLHSESRLAAHAHRRGKMGPEAQKVKEAASVEGKAGEYVIP